MTNENSEELFPQGANLHNGAYTVAHEKNGHFTVKLYTARRGDLAGKRIVALLMGPNNETDWKGVGFWDDDAERVNVWKRHRSPDRVGPIDGYHWGDKWNRIEQKLAIWTDLALREHGYWPGEGYTLLLEGRCLVCNKRLTEPESIRLGIGPTCRGKR